MFASAASISLEESQIQQLRTLARAGTTTQRVARRCRVILLSHEGTSNSAIGQQLGGEPGVGVDGPSAYRQQAASGVEQDRARPAKPGLLGRDDERIILSLRLRLLRTPA